MEKLCVSDLVTLLRQAAEDIKRYTGSRSDLKDLKTELGNLKVTAKKHLPLSITLEELLKGQQEAQQTRRLTSFWDYFLREEKTNSETNKQHLRNIEIRQRLKKAGFYTVLFIGISFAVEDFKLFNDNDVQEICTLAEEYIETYSLKDHFLQAGFYRVTQKLVRKVPDWEFDPEQFIFDAIEKHVGTSKNKDLANDDHTARKRSRDDGAIDPAAEPLQKSARIGTKAHVQDRNSETFVPGKQVVRFMSCDKGLYELRANRCRIRGHTMLVQGKGYWSLSFYPSVEMKDALMKLTEDNSENSKFNIPRGKTVYQLNLDEAFSSDLGPDCRVHHQATLFVNKEGKLSLTFFLTEDKGKELKKLPSFQVFIRKGSTVPT